MIARTDDGIPYAHPEIALLFKAKHADRGPKDEADFEAVLPRLEPDASTVAGRVARADPPRAPVAGAARVIAVVPYDAEWGHRFEEERALLEHVLAPWLEGGIHHVGSTAVPGPGCEAVRRHDRRRSRLRRSGAAYAPLETQGYVHTPHRPGIAHHFSKPSADLAELTHGLHLTEPGSDLWRERLVFRDALRGDPALAAEYAALKLRLAQQHPHDAGAYTHGKRAFVARVLAEHGLAPGRR